MKTKLTLLCAAGAPALLALAPMADEVSFAPESGTSVTKTFTSNATFSLDDMEMLMNGEPNPMMPELSMTMNMVQEVSVTDTYGGVSGGRPTKVTRTFNDISNEMEMDMEIDMMGETQTENGNGSGSSDLDGETVVFTWDEDAGEYVVSFAEGDGGDPDLLENLTEDMDMRALLPPGEVSEGDSYEIPLVGLIDVFAPGGDLKIDMEMDGVEQTMGPDPTMMSNFREILEEMLEGDANATYLGTRDVDGVKCGAIEIELDIIAARDMSDLVADMMSEQMPAEVEVSIDRMDVEFMYQGGGELLWNLADGVLHSLELEGDAEMTMDMEMNMDMGGQAMTMAMMMAMSGVVENAVVAE